MILVHILRLALIAALLLAGSARAQTPMTEQHCHEMNGEFIAHTREGSFPACGFGDQDIYVRERLDRIELMVKALCRKNDCALETKP